MWLRPLFTGGEYGQLHPGASTFAKPHVHVVATAGVLDADGTFYLAPTGGWQQLQELWRHALLCRLRAASALADWHVARLLSWRHSGFTVDAGEAPIAADDAAGRRWRTGFLDRPRRSDLPGGRLCPSRHAGTSRSQSAAEPIELLVQSGDTFRTVKVNYHGGLRYPQLERVEGTPDRIGDIAKPRS